MSSVYVVCWIFLQTFKTYFCIQANMVDPDQTAPRWAVWSGSTWLQKWLLKSQADDKADDNCFDWQFKGLEELTVFQAATLSKLSYPLPKRCPIQKDMLPFGGKCFLSKLDPFSEGVCMQKCKQIARKVVSLVNFYQTTYQTYQIYPVTLIFGPPQPQKTYLLACASEGHSNYENTPFKYIGNFTNKNWKFSDKNSDILHISAQNIDCGYSLEPPRRGGSNEYPQSMILSRNKKNNVYPCKPQFYYIKVRLRGGLV